MQDSKRLQDIIDGKILEGRKVFLWGQVDDQSAKHVVDRLLYLEMIEPEKEIQFFINSPGGYITSGFTIYDMMKNISSPVSTICTGYAASMGSILLSAGEKGRRFIHPHARVMIHQPSGGARGQASDIKIQLDELLKSKQLGAELLAENCGKTIEQIMKDFDRDYWMSASESVDYGIVDGLFEKL